jgi:Secretion system C-terminal sorting domain
MKSIFLILAIFLLNSTIFTQTIIFKDDFEVATLGSKWTTGAGTPNGIIDISTDAGFNNTRGVRMGKTASAGGFVTNTLDLRVDLSNQTYVALTFKISDRNDDTQAEDGLFLSDNNGVTFKKIYAFSPSDWCNQYGQFPPFDLTKLAAANGLSLNTQSVIRFQQRGEDYLPSYDGFFIDDVNVYTQTLNYATLPFSDDFEAAKLGNNWIWSFADQTNTLAAIPTRPSNIVAIENGIGIDNSRAVSIGKTCSDGFATNALDLLLNLAGQTQVAMTFMISDRNDETHVDDGLYFSDNGGLNFKKVFSFKPSDWCNQYGQYPPFDIDKLATDNGLSLTPNFIIRFQQHGENYLPSYDGFYIDNVNVYVPMRNYTMLPFFDDFEGPNLSSSWVWSFADQTNTLAAIPTRPSNIVDIENGIGINNSRAVRMGKACSDGFATNALDLLLNLANQPQVAMTFMISDRDDETHADDGIYFSDNGGSTFKKVFSFKPSDWCNQYGQYPPFDIDKLASDNGLTLTPNFIIRFQQHGEDYLPSYDGFYIDNVNVYVPTQSYATLPFVDDFEVPTLGSAWTWAFADLTNTLATIPTRPSNIVNIASGIGFNNTRGVQIGKACSDGFATNALDLHLNLGNVGVASMTFKINDRDDNTQADDALFFSDNGGLTFKKVFSFDFSNTANTYTDYLIDIDNLAATNGLLLTPQFVIRFQQHGEDYLPSYDGIYLDNININGTVGTNESHAEEQRVQIFPNPANDMLNIHLEAFNPNDKVAYQIHNVIGQQISSNLMTQSIDNVDISQLPKGSYFVTIKGEKWQITKPFIKI